MEDELVKVIEENLLLQEEAGIELRPNNLGKKWRNLVLNEPNRFINSDFTLRREILKNFRGLNIFVPDWPFSRRNLLNDIRNIIDGDRRGHKKMLRGRLKILKDYNFDWLLKKYPCSLVGNPNIFYYKGYRYTFRWSRHIYLLGLFKQALEEKLSSNFISLDVGSSYGIISSLLKKEFSESHHILLDFPEQLVLAHYFLGKEFPSAKIASFKEFRTLETIDKKFICQYDFILLPWMYYKKIKLNTVDLLTNFFSFGEMSKEYFDYYLNSEPFLSVKYFFTVNRFHSNPTYENNISILDYPLRDFTRIHFAISPLVSERYRRHLLFFYKYWSFPSQCFEFIGVRKTQ